VLIEYYHLKNHLSSSSRREQVAALRRVLSAPNFLRKAIEQGLITEEQAHFYALAQRIFTDEENNCGGAP
jgi:hypothetical protein